MKADEWAENRYDHERARAAARKWLAECDLTVAQVRACCIRYEIYPPKPAAWGDNRGLAVNSPLRIHGLTEDGESVVLSTDIGQQGAGPPGAAPGRDDLLPDSDVYVDPNGPEAA